MGHGVGPVVSRVKEQESSVQFLKPLNQVLKDDPRVGSLDKNNDFAVKASFSSSAAFYFI